MLKQKSKFGKVKDVPCQNGMYVCTRPTRQNNLRHKEGIFLEESVVSKRQNQFTSTNLVQTISYKMFHFKDIEEVITIRCKPANEI